MIDINKLMWSGAGGVPVVQFKLSSGGANMDDVAAPRGPDPTTDSKVGGKPKKRKTGGIADQPEKKISERAEGRDKKRKQKKTPRWPHIKQFLTVVESK